MAKRFRFFKMFLLIFTVIVDIYSFVALYALLREESLLLRLFFEILFWSVSAAFLILFLFFPRFESGQRDPAGLSGIFLMIGIYSLIYLPKLLFIGFRLTEDVVWVLSWAVGYPLNLLAGVSFVPLRLTLLSKAGLILSIIPFIAILWGLIFGRFHYQLERTIIEFEDLPEAFSGLKIIQLSDIHLGSAYGKQGKLKKAVDLINSLQPDLVLFTGDLVNNFTEEAHGWEELFSSIEARYGKFSVMGNHDYGDYWEWKSDTDRRTNMMMFFKVHEDMGFHLMRNSWHSLVINGGVLGLIGVENWGNPPFKQYGDLEKSLTGIPATGFNILLSHDPSHWDAQVTGRPEIQLTLSGHTHAMQFGFRLGKFKWSPSKYLYKRWMGLYRQNDQALYVNRGLGFIGFPGRIGLRPEIALITLKRKRPMDERPYQGEKMA
jgi:uncharacterized protein